MDGVIHTVRGNVAVYDNYVSLSDMYVISGEHSNKLEPLEWAKSKRLVVNDTGGDVLAFQNIAMAYAWYLSPTMAGTLQAQLDHSESPYTIADKALTGAADKSRELFIGALKAAGICDSHDFSRLTNLLYKSTLDATAPSLAKSYQVVKRSVRKSLDTESLAKIMTAEINICAAIYTEQVKGFADVAHKIKQHGALAQRVYRKTH